MLKSRGLPACDNLIKYLLNQTVAAKKNENEQRLLVYF